MTEVFRPFQELLEDRDSWRDEALEHRETIKGIEKEIEVLERKLNDFRQPHSER